MRYDAVFANLKNSPPIKCISNEFGIRSATVYKRNGTQTSCHFLHICVVDWFHACGVICVVRLVFLLFVFGAVALVHHNAL